MEKNPVSSKNLLAVLLFTIFLAILFRTAWIGDDAFITLRSVDNLIHGYGLNWNVAERVQSFTHPLWMLVMIISHSLISRGFFAILSLSMIFSASAFLVFLAFSTKNDLDILIGSAILLFSNAFIDYSTSGLENPLTHLLALGFILLFLKTDKERTDKQIFFLGLLAGLATLNRMDSILLFLPALGYIFWQQRKPRTLLLLGLGFLPFVFWEVFSVIYYGFPLPNTYFAKLNTGLSHRVLAVQGVLYFLNSLSWDPITLTIIFASIALTLVNRLRKETVLAFGVLLYLSYIIYIGGDFMSGRYFSTPLLICVVLLLQYLAFLESQVFKASLLGLVILLGFTAPSPAFDLPKESYIQSEVAGIQDMQSWFRDTSTLVLWGRTNRLPNNEWVDKAFELKESQQAVYVGHGIGYLGYFAGPGVYIADFATLADPLRSHLPIADDVNWMQGHFRRNFPPGYLDSLNADQNLIKDPNLAAYYDKILLIVRGDLWSEDRWEAIWKLNTGQYDYLLEAWKDR